MSGKVSQVADFRYASEARRQAEQEPGARSPQDFFEIPDEEWTRFFEVNVMSGVRLSRGYLPGMVKRN